AMWAIRLGLWRRLLMIGCALIFGSMIAAAYFFPAIAERNLVNYDNVEHTWPYHASYVYDFAQKVYDHAGNSFFARFFTRLDHIWSFTAVAILILGASSAVAYAVLPTALRRSQAGKGACAPTALRSRIWLWASAGLIACFLMTKYSEPIGRLIPKIEIGVF